MVLRAAFRIGGRCSPELTVISPTIPKGGSKRQKLRRLSGPALEAPRTLVEEDAVLGLNKETRIGDRNMAGKILDL